MKNMVILATMMMLMAVAIYSVQIVDAATKSSAPPIIKVGERRNNFSWNKRQLGRGRGSDNVNNLLLSEALFWNQKATTFSSPTGLLKSSADAPQSSLAATYAANSLMIPRGGSAGFNPDDSKLQFYENFCGSLFSFILILYGVACGIDPRGTAKLLYGHHKSDPKKEKEMQVGRRNKISVVMKNEDDDTVKFLMRLISYLTLGMGLTAAFSVASEIKGGMGQMAPHDELLKAIGIGMIPRAFLAFCVLTAPLCGMKPLSKDLLQRINLGPFDGRGGFGFNLFATTVLICTTFKLHILPSFLQKEVDDLIWGEIVFDALGGVVLFFFPQLMFRSSIKITKHERLLTRLLALYLLMYAPLLLALQLRQINAYPAIGVATLSYVVHQFLLQFASGDYRNALADDETTRSMSQVYSTGMIFLAILISMGTLWNYVTL